MKVNVLGTEYEVIEKEEADMKGWDGYCDSSVSEIAIAKFTEEEGSLGDLEQHRKKVLRHEIIHAFLNESGLMANSDWARNEEMVDWIAIQFYKIAKAVKEVDC